MDFVAASYNTLIVLSGANDKAKGIVYPRDAYNVLTVRAAFDAIVDDAEKIGTETVVARRVSPDSVDLVTDQPAATQRILTHLIAPSAREVATIKDNGTADDRMVGVGDSFAAPMATGTVALLQEHARKATSGIGADAKQEEVMKAVLINSADKKFGLLGMTRTVVGKNGKNTWFDSAAADTPNKNIANPYDATDPQNKARQALPLDIGMGAGFLNAARALKQLKGKQFAPESAAEAIGWDYRSVTRAQGDANPVRKVYNLPELAGGSYISATLTWNRDVAWNDANSNGKYDQNEALTAAALANLDLYLLPRGETDLAQAVWASNSAQYNVEHFFVQLPAGKRQYDLVVVQNTVAATNYGLAWWAETPKGVMQGPHKIDGTAWADANGNGTREPGLGEEVLAGIPVQLLDATNQVLDETTTNYAGAYQFEGVPSGSHTIRFVTPLRGAVTVQDVYNPLVGADDTNDSDIGTLGTVSVSVTQDLVNVDAGYTFLNAAPVGVADTYVAPHGGSLVVSAGSGVLANDTDPENDALTAELFRAPDVGTLTLAANGSFTYSYSPVHGFTGPVTFEYRSVDAVGVGDPVTVTITIPNSVPNAIDDFYAATPGPLVAAVLANDTDADGDALTLISATQGAHGTVTFTNGSLTYTPDTNWTGTDTFAYTISDGYGGTDTATVTVTMTAPPPPPTPPPPPPAPITISGSLWLDFNHDGNQIGEALDTTPVMVYLFDGLGNQLAMVPAVNGMYSFGNLPPGQYQIRVAVPLGRTVSPQDLGPNDAIDNDFNILGHSAVFLLGAGASLDLDIGWW